MSKPTKLTPMMHQYLTIKDEHKETILFYRMGDFYEMFFDDAILASKILGITLTSRNSKSDKDRIPMCGIPYHASQTYLSKLVKAGKRVAICEQVEDPAQAKGIVKREVVRVISPGVVTDNNLLDDKNNNYVAAVTVKEGTKGHTCGLSLLDISTGHFLTGEFLEDPINPTQMLDQLSRFTPSEILINIGQEELLQPLLKQLPMLVPGICLTHREKDCFHYSSAYENLLDHFQLISLDGFGLARFNPAITAAGALLDYIVETQKSSIDHIERLIPIETDSILQIDESSRRNLELTQTIIGGSRDGSLLAVLDNCRTPMGSRMLKNHILFPLRSSSLINSRLDAVNYYFQHIEIRKELRQKLQDVYDMERLNSRIVLGSANARDLLAIKHSLTNLPNIHCLLEQVDTKKLIDIRSELDLLEDIHLLLEQSIAEEPPITIKDGNIIKEGYNEELDELIHILRDGKNLILNLEKQEREATGIPKLKIGFNKVFGYFIEISRANQDKVPEHYIRKQTLVNAERFITPELKEFEAKVLGAQDTKLDLEYNLFTQIRQDLAQCSSRILKTAKLLAKLDVIAGLADSAYRFHYRRPTVNNENILTIHEGRHPVIEQSLPSGKFVPNDIHLNQESDEVLIITGPNMAGKSTVLRQTALIVLMAQMGSFVPAETATIGIVDRIFTRVGAMDDLRRGQSTFMVEMSETANILNNVTPKSLVILDEIGRGTSTFDGLSIAWAVAEELVNKSDIGVKTLFATHYHELTELASTHKRVKNFSIAVKDWNDTIIFLHKLIRGGTSRSYGIQVASLAGVPTHVVERAKIILSQIEKGELHDISIMKKSFNTNISHKKNSSGPNQLPLFPPPKDLIREIVSKLNIDDLSPREALAVLYDLKSHIE